MSNFSACAITGGWDLGCRQTGGVQNVWIGQYNSNQMVFTLGTTGSNTGVITGITGSTVSFYQFTAETEVDSSTGAGTVNIDNGTQFTTTTLQFTMYVIEQAMINILNQLQQGRWRIIYLDQVGNYWLLGYRNPVNVVSSTPGTGQKYDDLNGAIVTMESKEPFGQRQLTTAAALSVLDTTTFLGP